jgi:hypothetical protein
MPKYFSFLLPALITALQFVACQNVTGQREYNVTFLVADSTTLEPLTGASIYIEKLDRGTVSNIEGKCQFKLGEGFYDFTITYIGYKDIKEKLNIKGDTFLVFHLTPINLFLSEIVVRASKVNTGSQGIQTGLTTIESKEIKALPALLGEKDPVRALQYIPGVQTVTDGDMGYYIRGGGPDQNLILYENTVVYNPLHVLGFFSVFNNDMVDKVKLIKSGIPAEYGNRLSSVIDIHSPDSIPLHYGVSGNIGLISSKTRICGPLTGQYSGFYLAMRMSYIDQFVKPFILKISDRIASLYQNASYGFYDINAKIITQLAPHDRISFSFYYGKDNFRMNDIFMNYGNKLYWGNQLGILNWNHIFTDSWYAVASFYYTGYNFSFNANQRNSYIDLFSRIDDIGVKSRFVKTNGMQRIRFGFEYARHQFRPNNIDATISNTKLKTSTNQKLFSHEGALFAALETDITPLLRIDAGIRLTAFAHTGPYDEYIQNAAGEISDTVHHPKSEWLKVYAFPEPRFSGRFIINENSSLKFSFLYNSQYLHMATASSVTVPADVWLPSSVSLKPQKGYQITFGYFRDIKHKIFSTYADVYLKEMYNQIELLNGLINNFSDNLFEQSIVFGKGRSFGIELFCKKNDGKLTGWIGYSLSRHIRKFDDIGEGKIYPAKYDRRHDLKLAVMYSINSKWSVSGLFVYASGNAFTLPDEKYLIDGNILTSWGAVNSFRMPAYHRLDISISRTLKKNDRFESELVFSVFNVYNRPNPFYIYYAVTGEIEHYNLSVKAEQICVFPILPSLSWTFKF